MKTEIERFNENSEVIKHSLANARTEKAGIICAFLTGTLADDPAFKAAINLRSTGVANNYDGIRAAGRRLVSRWESEILHPALVSARKIKAARA